MKRIITLIAVIISLESFAQYGNAGVNTLVYKDGLELSVNITGGYRFGKFGAGVSADLYANNSMVIPSADFRYYPFKPVFIAVQPGWTLHTKGLTGSFAGSAIAGYNIKLGEIGLTFTAGYQYYSFKGKVKAHSDVFKAGVGILF